MVKVRNPRKRTHRDSISLTIEKQWSRFEPIYLTHLIPAGWRPPVIKSKLCDVDMAVDTLKYNIYNKI